MATSTLTTTYLEFLNSGSMAKLTASADIVTFSGAGGNVELKGIATPTSDNSAATKTYVDNIATGLY